MWFAVAVTPMSVGWPGCTDLVQSVPAGDCHSCVPMDKSVSMESVHCQDFLYVPPPVSASMEYSQRQMPKSSSVGNLLEGKHSESRSSIFKSPNPSHDYENLSDWRSHDDIFYDAQSLHSHHSHYTPSNHSRAQGSNTPGVRVIPRSQVNYAQISRQPCQSDDEVLSTYDNYEPIPQKVRTFSGFGSVESKTSSGSSGGGQVGSPTSHFSGNMSSTSDYFTPTETMSSSTGPAYGKDSSRSQGMSYTIGATSGRGRVGARVMSFTIGADIHQAQPQPQLKRVSGGNPSHHGYHGHRHDSHASAKSLPVTETGGNHRPIQESSWRRFSIDRDREMIPLQESSVSSSNLPQESRPRRTLTQNSWRERYLLQTVCTPPRARKSSESESMRTIPSSKSSLSSSVVAAYDSPDISPDSSLQGQCYDIAGSCRKIFTSSPPQRTSRRDKARQSTMPVSSLTASSPPVTCLGSRGNPTETRQRSKSLCRCLVQRQISDDTTKSSGNSTRVYPLSTTYRKQSGREYPVNFRLDSPIECSCSGGPLTVTIGQRGLRVQARGTRNDYKRSQSYAGNGLVFANPAARIEHDPREPPLSVANYDVTDSTCNTRLEDTSLVQVGFLHVLPVKDFPYQDSRLRPKQNKSPWRSD